MQRGVKGGEKKKNAKCRPRKKKRKEIFFSIDQEGQKGKFRKEQ